MRIKQLWRGTHILAAFKPSIRVTTGDLFLRSGAPRDAERISVAADSRFPPLRRQVVRSNGGAPSSAPPSTTFISFMLATLLRCREPLAASQLKRFEQPVR